MASFLVRDDSAAMRSTNVNALAVSPNAIVAEASSATTR